MNFITQLLLFSFLSHAETAKTPISFLQLDQMIVKTCTTQSGESACKEKLNQIRQGISPEQLLPIFSKLPIDSDINTIIIKDPSFFLANYYCLAVYNSIIVPEQISPDIFPYIVYGFSYSTSSEKNYKKWLNSKESQKCRTSLEELKITPVAVSSKKHYNIILNPITFLENGTKEEFNEAALKNYNHERLHAVFSQEVSKKNIVNLWNSMSDGEKSQFKLEHPGYNFENSDILYRELFSYTFSNDPLEGYAFLRNKKVPTFQEVTQHLCPWCINSNKEVLEEIKTLSKLAPKDLLAKVESEKIKVLILSAGRKNPLKFFYWGQIREDKGVLNQISKLENAMGKTLCQGERPEAQEGATIILASDSPYSTLLHEYLHILQIRKDLSWCPVSKRLWENMPIASETRMIRDREWDVRLVLWKLMDSPQMSLEDQIIVTEGLLREGEARKEFDPEAKNYLKENQLEAYLQAKVEQYQKLITK